MSCARLGRRLRKTAKLHFFDSGLVCHLLGIRSYQQLVHHPLRGAIFETWVAAEAYKARVNRGLEPALHHLREDRGAEIDLVLEAADHLLLVEAKSGATVVPDAHSTLNQVAERMRRTVETRPIRQRLVYGGDASQARSQVQVVSWSDIQAWPWD